MGKNINFAICEDHSLEREIIQIYIENYFEKKDVKVNVTEFKSGTELLASDYSDIDIAFLDIYMDDIDGIETARRMAETNKNVKFVFCSASPEFIDQVEDLNVFRYFIKPLSPGKFNDAMDEYMKELD